MQTYNLSYRRAEHSFVDDKGFVHLQPDRHGGDGAGGRAYELLSPHGFYSRPLSPDKPTPTETQGVAAPLLVFLESFGNGFAMPLCDARFAVLVPDCGAGGLSLVTTLLDGTTKKVATLRMAGAGVGVTQGTLEIRTPTEDGSGELIFTLDTAGSGSATLSHPGGTSIELQAAKAIVTAPTVELGGEGGSAVAIASLVDARFTALDAAISAGITSAGGAYTPPPAMSIAATKVKVL